MPLYEFLCACGHRFERLCKVSDQPFFYCPECGEKSRRVMSTFCRGRDSGTSGTPSHSSSGGCSGCSSSSCAGCH